MNARIIGITGACIVLLLFGVSCRQLGVVQGGAIDVSGIWDALDNENGKSILNLVQIGDRVQGDISQWGTHAITMGRVADKKVHLFISEGNLSLALTATVTNTQLVDGVSFDNRGHRTTWIAVRRKK